MSAKWLEMLERIIPGIQRNSSPLGPRDDPRAIGGWDAITMAAPALGVEVETRSTCATRLRMERGVAGLGAFRQWRPDRNGGPLALLQGDMIIALAARHKLPTIFFSHAFVTGRGLISYRPDVADQSATRRRLCRSYPPARDRPDLPGAGARPDTSWC